ncbi:MAG TPA: ATP-binding protein [Noviherbaspirillum sp.]|jgi:signal transduction histidine kinase|uniref:hybrid sensor histidine kinase/response regulator n=1 Tax=Noviherbaspirillum sp. TaxID=1926288 RepID=UPI002F92DAB9
MSDKKTWHLSQLLALLAAIALLPVVLAGAWAIRSAMEQHRGDAERAALDLSRALAIAVAAELESSVSALRTLSGTPALLDGEIADFYPIAKNALKARPGWKAVILTDRDGRMLFSTRLPYGAAAGAVVDPDSHRRAVETRQATFGSALPGPEGQLAYPVRVPVVQNGAVQYVLTAAVMPDRMIDLIQKQNAPPSWILAVFDASGKRVARTRAHETNAPSPSLRRLLAENGTEGVGVTKTLEGVESLTAFTRVHGASWVVAVGIPVQGLQSGLLQGIVLYLAGILASVVAYVIAATILARGIARGVDGLHGQASRLVRETARLPPLHSRIREVNEVNAALMSLSEERVQIEAERANLLTSLNAALDTARQALARAEEAGRAKDMFLAMLGHELRNPLAPIVSALDLMEIRGDDRTARERGIMRRQVEHLHRLVDDLLDVSRIVQGKLEIRQEPVDLKDVAQCAHEAVRRTSEYGGTVIESSLPDAAVWVTGDAARLVQAATNLLANALRFAPGGRVRLAVHAREGSAAIVVEDDGAGMAPEILDKVFQPFFQAPQSIARSTGGLGLGLAIVRSIVELHGGRVHADSKGAGKGSRFEIILPSGAAPGAAANASATAVGIAGRRILVVDDNVDAAELVAAGLSAAGHEVRTAHEADDALDLLRSFQPEVAILDIGMPGMSGYELATAIRSHAAGWDGKLIALSGYGQANDKERARAAGFDVHLTKPVRIAELNQVLH